MTIRRDDLDAGRIDLSDVADSAGQRLQPVHPGDVLKHDYLEPLGLSVYGLAGALGVSRSRIDNVVHGRRGVTAETALRLARFFGTSPEFWLSLQAGYDAETTRAKLGSRISAEVRPPRGLRRRSATTSACVYSKYSLPRCGRSTFRTTAL